MIERTFPDGLKLAVNDDGAQDVPTGRAQTISKTASRGFTLT
jgi:hypothetical protein